LRDSPGGSPFPFDSSSTDWVRPENHNLARTGYLGAEYTDAHVVGAELVRRLVEVMGKPFDETQIVPDGGV